MSLRLKLAFTFGFVAIVTASAVAIATPTIVSRGFERVQAEDQARRGGGQGRGPGGAHAVQVERETTLTIIGVAALAALAASLLGVFVAGRLVRPLGGIGRAAVDVAAGDLSRRSGVSDRADEIGDLGRSFDAMADALSRSDSARRRFFQDAVHELKTPLTVIDATTTAILDGVYAHEDKHLETVRQQSRLLARTVDDLRIVSLAESGTLSLAVVPVRISDLFGELVGTFTAQATGAGVELGIAADTPDLVAPADRDRLRQVFAALLDNALRYTPRGGTITLEARADADSVVLAVRDTGPGIVDDDLPHLFERFYRADPARDRASGSSGLGLAIVAALVSAHGGTVGVENAVGGGARFWVRLPAGS